MPRSDTSSPARSLGSVSTRRATARLSKSMGSPGPSGAKGTVQKLKESARDSFVPSPLSKTVLNDNTDIEEPRRASWWKNVDNSRDITDVLAEKPPETNNIVDEFDVEILSQENKENDTLDIPESSGSESINSIVVPQRKLFTQKQVQPQTKYDLISVAQESMAKLDKTQIEDKPINVGTKNLFGNATKRSKPIFPSALLNISADKTANKTKEMLATEIAGPSRNLLGNRAGTKRKNMFTNFVMSESEDEIPDIETRRFTFTKQPMPLRRKSSASRGNTSPASSVTTEIDMDDWRCLPSSTMMEHQLEDPTTPGVRTRLSKIAEKEASNKTFDKSKQSNKSPSSKNKSNAPDTAKESDNENKAYNAEKIDNLNKTKQLSKSKIVEIDKEDMLEKTLASIVGQEEEIKEHDENNDENIVLIYDEDNQIVERDHNTTEGKDTTETQKLLAEKEKSLVSETPMPRKSKSTFSKIVNETLETTLAGEEQHDEIMDIEQNEEAIFKPSQELRRSIVNQDKSKHMKDDAKEISAREKPQKNDQAAIDFDVIKDQQDKSQNAHVTYTKDNEGSKQDMKDKKIQVEEQLSNYEIEGQRKGKTLNAPDKETESQTEVVDVENEEHIKDLISGKEDQNEGQMQENEELRDGLESENEEQIKKIEEHDQMEVDKNPQDVQGEDEIEEHDQTGLENVQEKEESGEHDQSVVKESSQNEEEIEQSTQNEEEIEQHEQTEVEDVQSEEEIEEHEQSEAEQYVQDEEEIEHEEVSEVENEEDMEEGDGGSEKDHDQEQDEDDVQGMEDGTENEIEDNEGSETDSENHERDSEVENEEQNEEVQESTEDDDSHIPDTPNASHDTTGRNRKKQYLQSPEAVLFNKTNTLESFTKTKGRNTSIRKSVLQKNFSLRPSMAPPRESTGLSDGTKNSSAEGSGWDSHRNERKTLRLTLGKDFSPRKSLRALVMEKSDKRKTVIDEANANLRLHEANSSAGPVDENQDSYNQDYDHQDSGHQDSELVSHDVSLRTKQSVLEQYLQKKKKEYRQRKIKIDQEVRNYFVPNKKIKHDILNDRVPMKLSLRKPMKTKEAAPGVKRAKRTMENLPPELLEDMKYKPPKRFKASNAPWITKRLYHFLESKLEPKYDYKARVRAEKLVEALYTFAQGLRRQRVASPHAVDELAREMARLDIVQTHYDFYRFFGEFMPNEIKYKVVPDYANAIPHPRKGIFSDILD